MTLQAIITGRRAVFEDRNIGHLPPKRRPGDHVMTLFTAHTLTGSMVAVPENGLEIILRLLRPLVRCQRMAHGAGTDLTFRRVAGITVVVRIDA